MFIDIRNTKEKFKVILADPPWDFKTYSDSGKGRSADQHYPILSLKDIKEMPVKKLADDNCALFLWITDPCLEQGLEVLKAWGFKYKTTAFYWIKVNKTAKLEALKADKDFFTGMGYWTRANPESCLLGFNYDEEGFEAERCLLATKGSPQRESMAVRRLIIDYRREHSRKPDAIYSRINALMGDVSKLELFARNEVTGWDCFGNEIKKFNN